MEQAQQVEYIGKILELEKKIDRSTSEVTTLDRKSYKSAPPAPTHEQVRRDYPTAKSSRKWNIPLAVGPMVIAFILYVVAFVARLYEICVIALILEFLGMIWVPVYYFAVLRKQRKEDAAAIEASQEWQAEISRLTSVYDAQQAELDKKYTAEKETYDSETMPAYEAARAKWEAEKEKKLLVMREELNDDKTALKGLYDESRLVPKQFRTIEALQYIYNSISSSNFDVQQAIRSYENHLQRQLDDERNRIANEQNALLAEQNDLAAEQNEIAAKARRDANIAAVVSTYQRHKTNSKLDKLIK